MLFCTQQFTLFFAAVFGAYWSLHWRWARAGMLAAAAYTCYYIGTHASAVPPPGFPAWMPLILAELGDPGWLAVIIGLATLSTGVLGPDRGRVLLLLGASFYFYASWNHWLALIICVSTALDYLIARGMEALAAPRWRRLLLGVSLAGNLGLLCYFKYANFFLHSLEQALHAAGVGGTFPVMRVILPIGISFYTFEAINYTVDVYRRKVPAERNLFHFMLFITFFPHLVAGPIVRARDFLPQIRRPKQWNWLRLQLGAEYCLMGLFKKVAIADRMALFVDPVFANPQAYGSQALWLAVLGYALQIYCDFSGYTDMALGTAHLLGYKLAQNFNLPYLSANVSEFWRRWHISLSSWLRDYLFIPLGGSRGSNCPHCRRRSTNRNFMVTMTLGGLWHGAAWTFVVWGILHGAFLVIHRAFRDYCERRPRLNYLLATPPGTMLRVLLTFLCVCAAWVFFRATTFGTAASVLRGLVVRRPGLAAPLPYHSFAFLAAVAVLAHGLAHSGVWKRWATRLPAPVLGAGYAAAACLALVLTPIQGKPFIYFQF
jgi:alginate O-acetyltransferase complex protein AlgI